MFGHVKRNKKDRYHWTQQSSALKSCIIQSNLLFWACWCSAWKTFRSMPCCPSGKHPDNIKWKPSDKWFVSSISSGPHLENDDMFLHDCRGHHQRVRRGDSANVINDNYALNSSLFQKFYQIEFLRQPKSPVSYLRGHGREASGQLCKGRPPSSNWAEWLQTWKGKQVGGAVFWPAVVKIPPEGQYFDLI